MKNIKLYGLLVVDVFTKKGIEYKKMGKKQETIDCNYPNFKHVALVQHWVGGTRQD